MPNDYIFVDYENVQPGSLVQVARMISVKIVIFVGNLQKNIPFRLASEMQQLGKQAEYIKISGNGQNALDFHIAYYIGRKSEQGPGSKFYIITKDKGFDPLIQHLNTKRIAVYRKERISDIRKITSKSRSTFVAQREIALLTSQRPLLAKEFEEKKQIIIEKLVSRTPNCRPNKFDILLKTIEAWFDNQICKEDIFELINVLKTSGIIKIRKNKVFYTLT